jgi:hypothetical protein
MTKEEIKNLSDKLYKEGQTFRENKDKKQKEIILKEINYKEDYFSGKSMKMLLDKFVTNYNKILLENFNKKNNFQINLEEYKLLLNKMWNNLNSPGQIDEGLIKESFNKYLKQKDEKIDTYSFLIFCLAILGIYKGNDEIKGNILNSSTNSNRDNHSNSNRNSNRIIEPKKILVN